MPNQPLTGRERAALEAIDMGLVTITPSGDLRKPAGIPRWDIVHCFLDLWATARGGPRPRVELTLLGKYALDDGIAYRPTQQHDRPA